MQQTQQNQMNRTQARPRHSMGHTVRAYIKTGRVNLHYSVPEGNLLTTWNRDVSSNPFQRQWAHETPTQIGRANRGEAHFAVHLWNKPAESPGKIFFKLDFINDGTKKDRFQSAMFQVTFGYHDADKTHLPINLKDVFPTSAEQLVSHTVFDADLGIDLESDSASTRSQEGVKREEGVNSAFISGQGRHSPTATWNFVEALDRGLDAQYLVSVTLPTTSKIWMTFYGKAVHIRGGLTLGSGRAIIQVGSLEKPYERILDLSAVI